MPIPILGSIVYNGIDTVPFAPIIAKWAPLALLIFILRWWVGGAKNRNERLLHGKVIMVTGGTSGIGESLVRELASRGAQLVLLVRSTKSQFLIDRINDLRELTNNQLIYAEECDLSSLHSIRLFATKWIDNAPPRRLDMVILCASTMAPPFFSARRQTKDGAEEHWGINYLANFHLLNILSPALRAQPPDRDVRVVFTTCSSYVLGELDLRDTQFLRRGYPMSKPWKVCGASKMALMAFALEFQRRLAAYERPDGLPNNVRCYIVDPGHVRTPGMRRWLSLGTVWGLLVYLFTWPFWYMVLKNSLEGAQTLLASVMSPEYGRGEGGKLLRECQVVEIKKKEVTDVEMAKRLWEVSEQQIQDLEKKGAIERKTRQLEEQKLEKPKEQKEKKESGRKEDVKVSGSNINTQKTATTSSTQRPKRA